MGNPYICDHYMSKYQPELSLCGFLVLNSEGTDSVNMVAIAICLFPCLCVDQAQFIRSPACNHEYFIHPV